MKLCTGIGGVSLFLMQAASAQASDAPDSSSIELPETAFSEDPTAAMDFDKYFYFWRSETTYDQAFSDILQCDDLARGIKPQGDGSYQDSMFAQNAFLYGPAAAAAGGLIGGLIVGAMASAQQKNVRRHSMRYCMFYKGYERFGITKDLWRAFNSEDFTSELSNDSRIKMVAKQAAVASGSVPETKGLGL